MQRSYDKAPVVALVERDGGIRVVHMPKVTASNLREHIKKNTDTQAILMTDESPLYIKVGREMAEHHTVHHRNKEYSRGNVYSNTAESFFALLKRGVYGNFHHCGKKHLQKYCDEFSFRWNHRKVNDGVRREAALAMAEGKRLTYR